MANGYWHRGRRRSRAEWSRLVDAHQSSGLSVVQYCRERRLRLSTFRVWQSRLRRSPDRAQVVPAAATFVACDVGTTAGDAGGSIEVLLQGDERRARFSRDCPVELVVAVVAALRYRTCS